MAVEVRTYLPGDELEAVSDDVWKLLCVLDDSFVPPLSKRSGMAAENLHNDVLSPESLWGGPVSYFESVMTRSLALAYLDGTVAGIVSWSDNHVDDLMPAQFNPNFRILNIATHPDYVLQGVATAMLDHIQGIAKDSDCEWIVARYWSGSAGAQALAKSGFQEIARIPEHRGPGIDTIYFGLSNN